MITVNLLPKEFGVRPQSKTGVLPLKIAAIFGVLFSLLTVYFYWDILKANSELKRIQAQWTSLQPQTAALQALEEEVEKKIKPEKFFLESFVMAQRPLTSLIAWASEL